MRSRSNGGKSTFVMGIVIDVNHAGAGVTVAASGSSAPTLRA